MELINYLLTFVGKNKKSNIILSGGKSPLKLYKILSKKKVNFKNINFFLLDDRIVNTKSKYSNYNNIKKSFIKNKIIYKKIFPLNRKNCKRKVVEKKIYLLKKLKTLSILGMGADGHFASIFIESKNFHKQVSLFKKPSYVFTEKLGNPRFKRISMNLSMILLSNIILLILNTKKKIKLFKKISKIKKNSPYPISFLLKYGKKKILIYDGKKMRNLKDYTLQC